MSLSDLLNTPFIGDWFAFAAKIPDKSVHLIITSPPYFGGLRDYSVPHTVWQPEDEKDHPYFEGCEHEWDTAEPPPTKAGKGEGNTDKKKRGHIPEEHGKNVQTAFCLNCDAWKGPLGWEPTPQLYCWHMVLVSRELWRVLRDDGTFFLNIGDCYAGSGGSYGISTTTPSLVLGDSMLKHRIQGGEKWERRENDDGMPRYPSKGAPTYSAMGGKPRNPTTNPPLNPKNFGLKPGDLMMVPHMLAFALQKDGWVVKQDNVWAKKNTTPEPVKKRTTRAHEYIFQLNKSFKPQYWTHRTHHGMREKPEPDYIWIDRSLEPSYWTSNQMYIDDADETGVNTNLRTGLGRKSSEQKEPGYRPAMTELTEAPPGDWRNEMITGTKLKRWRRVNLWESHTFFYDIDNIRSPHKESSIQRSKYKTNTMGGHPDDRNAKLTKGASGGNEVKMIQPNLKGANKRSVWVEDDPAGLMNYLSAKATSEGVWLEKWLIEKILEYAADQTLPISVWDITTRGMKGAHFAVFPPELPSTCIKVGTSDRGCCPDCGAPWSRVTIMDKTNTKPVDPNEPYRVGTGKSSSSNSAYRGNPVSQTTGWRPTCQCDNDETVPCIVLDPFGGSFTTGMVANQLGRDWLSCDLSPDYVENVAKLRLHDPHTSITDPKHKARDLAW